MKETVARQSELHHLMRKKHFFLISLTLLSFVISCNAYRPTSKRPWALTRQLKLAVKDDYSLQKRDDDIWTSRRKIIRSTLKPIVKRQIERKETAVEKAKTRAVKDDGGEKERKKPTGLLVSAFFIAVSATVLRLGGRTAFVQMLGLDFVTGTGIKTQVNDFVDFFHSMGDVTQYAAIFLAWLAAKAFCVDAATIVLALSSGVLFGGILQGTAVSVVCSSTASLCVFFVSR
jgi:cbb3-type cytochrome oxidase subunit 3